MYAEKISKAQSEGEKLSLSVERDSRLAGVEAQELRASIDWATVFGEFGGMFSDMVKPVLEDVKKYMQTDEFRNADQDSQQALVEAYRQMMEVTGMWARPASRNWEPMSLPTRRLYRHSGRRRRSTVLSMLS